MKTLAIHRAIHFNKQRMKPKSIQNRARSTPQRITSRKHTMMNPITAPIRAMSSRMMPETDFCPATSMRAWARCSIMARSCTSTCCNEFWKDRWPLPTSPTSNRATDFRAWSICFTALPVMWPLSSMFVSRSRSSRLSWSCPESCCGAQLVSSFDIITRNAFCTWRCASAFSASVDGFWLIPSMICLALGKHLFDFSNVHMASESSRLVSAGISDVSVTHEQEPDR
mmetsp:Transcript_68340/g.158591  ORF Transcript_68340/g.158591 Transcript_68340/m.158591 type:complete len:226 (+) Transcript_68340:227-904(+)